MVETEMGSVQGQARRAAAVGHRSAVQGAVVNAFAAKWGAGLAEVDAHLVRAAGLQAAFDQGVIAKIFQNGNVRHGALAGAELLPRRPSPRSAMKVDSMRPAWTWPRTMAW